MENAPEATSSQDQKVAAWNRFAESLFASQSRRGRMAARQNRPPSPTAGTIDWKAYALKAEKAVRGLRIELDHEKDISDKIKSERDAALKENDDLTGKLSDALEELTLLDPDSRRIQRQTVKDLEAKVAALEAEIRGLRSGAVAPEGQASEPRAIQQLDDNMGIDSDEEVDDFETDDESDVRRSSQVNGKADKGNSDREDELAEDEETLKL